MENRFVNRHGVHSTSGCSLAALVALVFVSQTHGSNRPAKPESRRGILLAARESFDQTAILRLGRSENLRGDIFWLGSDNKRQATEWDIYAEWEINDHLSVSPLIGFYTPSKSAGDGGVQLGNDDTNTYAQMTVTVSY